MSNLFGSGGSSKNLNPTAGFNIPFFNPAHSGGVTPEEQGLAEFTMGQNLLGEANLFGGEGLGQSTMATQGAAGAATGKAQELGQLSDINTQAEYGNYLNDVSNFESTLQNTLSLDALAQQAGGGGAEISGFTQGGGFQNTPNLANL